MKELLWMPEIKQEGKMPFRPNHGFDLTGAKKSDWFIGCPKCWWQAPMNAAVPMKCENCSNIMKIYDIGDDDYTVVDTSR